ncbi:DoxX family protein [Streptomyces sp. WAC 06738]|uniref:DoxX family protein n=1 Tax=Streptomyces sp. WAC 06738 TaxID=2203210 RepID=UPI000F6E49A7|nr:DoxX family protein [Streptomyces sp. WAC 06738]AZM46048.1 DoxX family protein [Streptomyces sp. WAC 06738]
MAQTRTIPAISYAEDIDEGVTGVDAGLLVLRAVVGVILAGHGAQKLLGWFDGPGFDATAATLAQAGYPSGRTMTWVLGLSEIVGGFALVIGFLTPLAAAAVIGVMINAVALKWGYDWSGPIAATDPRGIEYEFLLGAAGVALALTGAGLVSVDGALGRGGRLAPGVAAVLLGVAAGVGVLFLRRL